MTGIDVSIVLTLHREAKYIRRTVTALSEAAALARAQGISVELVTVLDRADFVTCAALQATDRSGFDGIRVIEVDHGSPGPSRNDGCKVAAGKYVAMSDGDDIMGHTLIARTFSAAEAYGPGFVFVPKFVFGFGAAYFTVEYFGQDVVSPLATLKHPLYSTRIFAHRLLFAQNRFADVPVSRGYAYEDWHFNCNAVALGWRFATVEATAWFYRERTGSQMHESDRISARQIPPSALFRPANFLRLFASEIDGLQPPIQRPAPLPRGETVLEDPAYRDLIRHANAIEPAVELGRYHWNCLGHFNNLADATLGAAYYRACEIVGQSTFDAVFLLSGGEGHDFLLHEMQAIAASQPNAAILVLLDASDSEDERPALLPASALLVDLGLLCLSLPAGDRDLIALKLLQSCAASASLHCGASAFSRRFFARFGVLLRDWRVICYRPPDHRGDAHGISFADPQPFEFLSDHLDVLDRIVWFDEETMAGDWHRLPALRSISELHLSGAAPAPSRAARRL